MADSQEKKTINSQDSRTINIEIPAKGFEAMFRMMTGSGYSGKTGSSCCEMTSNRCCPQSEEDEKQEFKIVIKKKER